MKKVIMTLICFALAVFSVNKAIAEANNTVELKKYANEVIKFMFAGDKSSANDVYQKMYDLGAEDIGIVQYLPCPRRTSVKIAGRSVPAKNKRCFVLTYSYKGIKTEVGDCRADQ